MQRLKARPDRGAVAVVVATVLVVIMAMAALSIDVAGMHSARQQLQTGADAAVLAVAQDCARNNCSQSPSTTQSMAEANLNSGIANGRILSLDEALGTVTVQTSSTREHSFAPILGIDSTLISARASARWGYPTGGTAVLPLAFSWCELEAQAGIQVIRDASGTAIGIDIPATTPDRTIYFPKTSATGCNGPSGNPVPAGFAWLKPGASCGETKSAIGLWLGSDTGSSAPTICTAADFQRWVGHTVLLPIFDAVSGTGTGAKYRVFGYAAFTFKQYYFANQYQYLAPCGEPEKCIKGSFDRFVDLNEKFEYSPSGPRLGAAVVALTE